MICRHVVSLFIPCRPFTIFFTIISIDVYSFKRCFFFSILIYVFLIWFSHIFPEFCKTFSFKFNSSSTIAWITVAFFIQTPCFCRHVFSVWNTSFHSMYCVCLSNFFDFLISYTTTTFTWSTYQMISLNKSYSSTITNTFFH